MNQKKRIKELSLNEELRDDIVLFDVKMKIGSIRKNLKDIFYSKLINKEETELVQKISVLMDDLDKKVKKNHQDISKKK